MSQLRRHEDELKRLNVEVCVVTFEADRFAKKYAADTGLSWPVLVDSERKLYAAYGMTRAPWRKLLNLSSMRTYLKLTFMGRKIQRPTDDVQQMGGDVLIDPQGIVRLHHVSSDPSDRPDIETLLDRVRQGGNRPGAKR